MLVTIFSMAQARPRAVFSLFRTGQTVTQRDTRGTEGGVPMPGGNIPPPCKRAPWASLCHQSFAEGSPSHQRPRQLPQSPFWEDPGVFTKRSVGRHRRKGHRPRSPRGPRTSGPEAPGSSPRGTVGGSRHGRGQQAGLRLSWEPKARSQGRNHVDPKHSETSRPPAQREQQKQQGGGAWQGRAGELPK